MPFYSGDAALDLRKRSGDLQILAHGEVYAYTRMLSKAQDDIAVLLESSDMDRYTQHDTYKRGQRDMDVTST
jgi:hypothetical protein